MAMIRISPSTLDHLQACPCFQFKQMEVQQGPSAADEGVLMHSAFETGDDAELNEEQRRRVQQTRDLVQAQKTSYLDWENCPMDKRVELHEQKLASSHGLKGKMDRAYVNLHLRKALVFDSKYGRNGLIAEAKDSLQLASYGDILFLRFPGMLDEIRVILAAPRTNEISHHDYKAEDWPDIQARIQHVIQTVEDPFKRPTFNDAVCAKCEHIDRCPAAKKDSLLPTIRRVDGLQIPTSALLKPVAELTAEEIGLNKAFFDLMTAWIDKRNPELTERALSEGLEVPGYTKVRKEGAPFIPADAAGRAWSLLRGELSPEQFIAACGKPSISSLIDQLADNCEGDTLSERKAKAKAHLFELLEEVVAQSNGTQYLRRKAKLNLTLLEQKEVTHAGDNAQID